MVSKRTIDYYTSIGLLQAERSKSNYRIYSEESLNDLKFIEECKSVHYPLYEIKRKLEIRKAKTVRDSEVAKQIEDITLQMKQLQNELGTIEPILAGLDLQQRQRLVVDLTQQGKSLVKSLLNLTS